MMQQPLRKNGQFIKFFVANTLANLGNWFDFVGVLILFRYVWQADALSISLIPIMYAIPSILIGPFAGVLADRLDKRKIILYSDWIRAALTIAIVFTTNPTLVLLLLLLRNTAGTFSLPAQQGFMRSIVPEEQLLQAVTVNGSLFQLVKIIGPLIGASIVSVFSPQVAIAINAGAFFVSGLIYLTIRKQASTSEAEITENVPFLTAWKDGWRLIWNIQLLRASIVFGLFSTLAIQMIDVQIVTLFSVVFPDNSAFTGWAISAVGIGSLIIVLYVNRLKKLRSFGLFFGGGSCLIGVMALTLGMLDTFNFALLAIVAAFVGGVGNGLTYTALNYLIQSAPPKEAIGRVTSLIDAFMSVLFIVGPLIGGVLITNFGVVITFQAIGISLIAIGTTGLLLKRFIWQENVPLNLNKPHRSS